MRPEESKKYLENLVGDGSIEFVFQPIKTEVLVNAIEALERVKEIESELDRCGYYECQR